ncbi:hypothetical protein BDN72DRAFT_864040 [Pluteus cervinus]|uniref:Uncharacterized protein n=1 Tax=Pluteus cervinus TaxID=181527 RepID=A0ACD3A5J6_9AGAR|nr:hypothetical protein BDN72DRAFT_864040 [Pluteus cervinus]
MGRAPRLRRCRRCPGHQLLTECAHSKSKGSVEVDVPHGLSQVDSPAGGSQAPGPLIPPDGPTPSPMVGVDDSNQGPMVSASPGVQPEMASPIASDKPPRVRVTSKNAAHGYVEGCSRGSEPYRIRRPRALRNAMVDVHEATKRYYREINIIIARCERISRETGCYVLFNAQHMNSQTAPITFASGRLLNEAYDKTVELSSEFSRATSALLTAKKSTLIDMAMEINNLKREREEAENRARAAQEELAKIRGRGPDKLMDKLLHNLDEITIDSGADESGEEE